jgi:hypothetical protein
MEILRAPLNVWDKYSLRPGAVGSVGDCLIGVRLKQSAPDLNPRYEVVFSGKNEVYYGSNVSDGRHAGFTSGGGVAKTMRKPLGYRQGFKTAVGWVHQDIAPVDRTRQPFQSSLGQFGWKTTMSNIYKAKTTGDMFLPLPGGYAPKEGLVTRGSVVPRIVEQATADNITIPSITNPVIEALPETSGNTVVGRDMEAGQSITRVLGRPKERVNQHKALPIRAAEIYRPGTERVTKLLSGHAAGVGKKIKREFREPAYA